MTAGVLSELLAALDDAAPYCVLSSEAAANLHLAIPDRSLRTAVGALDAVARRRGGCTLKSVPSDAGATHRVVLGFGDGGVRAVDLYHAPGRHGPLALSSDELLTERTREPGCWRGSPLAAAEYQLTLAAVEGTLDRGTLERLRAHAPFRIPGNVPGAIASALRRRRARTKEAGELRHAAALLHDAAARLRHPPGDFFSAAELTAAARTALPAIYTAVTAVPDTGRLAAAGWTARAPALRAQLQAWVFVGPPPGLGWLRDPAVLAWLQGPGATPLG